MDCESNTTYLDLCRLCITEPGVCTIHEIEHLPREIFVCTGVEVIITDNLPKKICIGCHNIIKKAIDFRELVCKNDLHLKSLHVNTQEITLSEDLVSSTNSNIECKSKYFTPPTNIQQLEQNNEKQTQETTNPDNQTDAPVKLHKISIRKDLFPTPTQSLFNEEDDTEDSTKEKKMKTESVEVLEYRCGVCRRNFETWKKLYLHSRLHNKTRQCPIESCKKMFSSKGDLEKHVRTHTGEKPFECNVCQKKFSQKISLKNHVESIHRRDD